MDGQSKFSSALNVDALSHVIPQSAIDTQQRLVDRTLRSLTPMGVLRERYGILLALYERLLDNIASKRLAERRTPSNPRMVKRKSNFKLKRDEHDHPPAPTGSFRDAVVVQPCAVLELPRRPTPQLEPAVLEFAQREPCLI